MHPFAEGETVIVATTGALVVLIAVNEGIFPVPLAARPIDVLLFVQLKTVPLTAPLKLTALLAAPLHKAWLAGCITSGVGLTVIVKFCEAPGHPFANGETVIVAVTGALVKFVAVNAGILPLPLAARPMEVLLLVQLKPVPLTEPVKFTGLDNVALQSV